MPQLKITSCLRIKWYYFLVAVVCFHYMDIRVKLGVKITEIMPFSNGCVLFWNVRHASSCNWCFVRSNIFVIYYLQLQSVFIKPGVRVLTFRREVAEASVLMAVDAASHDNCIQTFRKNVPPSSSGSRDPEDLLTL